MRERGLLAWIKSYLTRIKTAVSYPSFLQLFLKKKKKIG